MANDTVITLVGNLVDDPELRFTPTGTAVARIRVASNPRFFDRATNDWKDGDSLFLTCNIWRDLGENAAESLRRGMRVIVQGRLKQRSYETAEGEKRTVYEVDVDEIGPSLRGAIARVTKANRNQAAPEDPWATATPAPAEDSEGQDNLAMAGAGANDGETPPF
ncbi:MAG: single-stranded DNA-binding protein [Nonomuraea sp.]|nr:single-stranded DNA-binding protein [Nonomuraea sp.]